MIELRWLVDPRSDAHRVLQYRELGPKSYTTDHNGFVNGATKEWGEWRDVPEVNGKPSDILDSPQ